MLIVGVHHFEIGPWRKAPVEDGVGDIISVKENFLHQVTDVVVVRSRLVP